jgi:5-methylcytosine-specific restriction endonuclease McrA
MPTAAPRACAQPGCPSLVTRTQPCPRHPRVWPEGRGSTRAWRNRRAQILREADYRCAQCAAAGRDGYAVEVDHIVPVSRGGVDALENLQPLCRAHHAAKTGGERTR